MTSTPLVQSSLPLPLVRRGKVREVYRVDDHRLLIVTSDRISAFDVVMSEPIPRKGVVLTQLSAFWFKKLGPLGPHHFLTADAEEIIGQVPAIAEHRSQIAGRAMLVRPTTPIPFECVIRGYLTGSAWKEYRALGTLAGERLPAGLEESQRFPHPIFSPATKADEGHDINVDRRAVAAALGEAQATELADRSLALYLTGQAHAESRGIIIADTKFEFGVDSEGTLRLIDEVLTPDSSRFWPADKYQVGKTPPSFDKQPLRDYLQGLKDAGRWNMEAPPPPLPAEIVRATSERYLEAYRLLTGDALTELTA